jgi:hypothetical protein
MEARILWWKTGRLILKDFRGLNEGITVGRAEFPILVDSLAENQCDIRVLTN